MPIEKAASWRPRFGAAVTKAGIRFSVWSGSAERLWVSIFDEAAGQEIDRLELSGHGQGVFERDISGLAGGTHYGFRADGQYDPENGLWFDPDKLLMDPYAVSIDRPYAYDPALTARRGEGGDTAPLMPKALAVALPEPPVRAAPLFDSGGLIYELPVRAFTMRHPDVFPAQRGTLAALRHPAIIAHLQRLRVSAVQLMPITAWIDERHLPPLGLSNAWGYNPVSFMALDPRLAPGGLAELRGTVTALHEVGIGVIMDVVPNHTGESDALGPTLSLRGLDNGAYYRHVPGSPGRLVNDTGCGNTLRADHPVVRELILDSLRHFVVHAGVDGFRFDLAPVLGRTDDGFDPRADLLTAMRGDPLLGDRVLIAEPWDVGPDGYQLGNFPKPFLEWNDRYRDDIRRFWRGDAGMVGALATRLAGSSDVFAGEGETRTVNFVAAHDGMTLADLVRYERKHNEGNGEGNRDGHDENLSWNNGVEGETADEAIAGMRRRDVSAILRILFASRGTIMLTAGDEFGRTQRGNNNAYAQDNGTTWLDWTGRDTALEEEVVALAALRKASPMLREKVFLTGRPGGSVYPDVVWLNEAGQPMAEKDWQEPACSRLTMILAQTAGPTRRIAVAINGDRRATIFSLPLREGFVWKPQPGRDVLRPVEDNAWLLPGRSVQFFAETAGGG